MSTFKHGNPSGFTIVELIVAAAVIGILAIPVSMLLTQFYAQSIATSQETNLAIDSHNILSVAAEDLRLSTSIKSTNSLSDANAPAGGWQTNSSNHVLVISTPSLNTSRNIVLNASTGAPYQDEIVYYLSGTELRKRYLANSGAANNRAKTTCPPGSTTPTCPADSVFSKYVTNFSFTMYDASNTPTTVTSNARSIQVSLGLTNSTIGHKTTYNDSLRVALRGVQ